MPKDMETRSGVVGSETSAQPIAELQDQQTHGSLLRDGGWFAIGGGLLLIADAIAHVVVDDTVTPTELLTIPHELWHVPGIAGIIAASIGLIAIYLCQAARAGALGKVGFVLLFVGVTLGAAYSTVLHAIFLPASEEVRVGLFEEFITAPATTAQVVRGLVVQAAGLGLGSVLFGAAIIRTRALPRLGGWLIIVAALFAAANEAFESAQLISRILFGAVFVFLGTAVVKERRVTIGRG